MSVWCFCLTGDVSTCAAATSLDRWADHSQRSTHLFQRPHPAYTAAAASTSAAAAAAAAANSTAAASTAAAAGTRGKLTAVVVRMMGFTLQCSFS